LRSLANLLAVDLTHSNLTRAKTQQPCGPIVLRHHIHWRREHAMAAAMNGIALHKGFIPYGGTFLVFADYSRPSIRLAALMGIRVIHSSPMTRSIGEDGPTHQPVEHLARCERSELLVFRPMTP
jgi:transketolase